jgi:vitellogenic carboxypeptidase-like protein
MFTNQDSLFIQATGFEWFAFYNIMIDKPVDWDADFVPFLELPDIRNALHVGSVPFDYVNFTTGEQLTVNDNFRMRPIFEDLLSWSQYKILIAAGQFDMIVFPHGVNDFVRSLSWPGKEAFNRKARDIWRVDGRVAGYSKSEGNFTQVLVRNTGHDMNYESLEWTSDMAYKFTRGLPFQ